MGYTSAEVGLKIRGLGKRWGVMFAGKDISHASSVIQTASNILEKDDEITGIRAASALSEAYHTVRRKQIENRLLLTYDMSMQQFMEKGKDAFPESHHLQLLYDIANYDLGCIFLAAGFMSDRSKYPCLFMVQNPGEFFPMDDIGYSAVGSGDVNAISHLARRNQDVYATFERSLYTAIAAKHLAEKAQGVGKETFVVILEPGVPKPLFLQRSQIEQVSKMWREEEEHVEPQGLEKRMIDIIGNLKGEN